MMQSSWTNLRPTSISARDVEEPEQNAAVVVEIVSLGMFMGLEVDSEDVEELLEDHNAELTTEELRDLHMEQWLRNCLQRRRR
jgi:hypothetical protein